MKILLTGDLHLGRKYISEEPEVAGKYIDARMQALKNAVDIANKENCDFFVIAGDLYDKAKNITEKLHNSVCQILDEFSGEAVLVLPGNHDYYDATNDEIWRKFEKYSGPDTKVFKENKKYQIGNVVFYPCICHDKLSSNNSLGWLSDETERNPELYHIGIAHGAVEGLSYDGKQVYYYMSRKELLSCNMDIWLVGHTHIAYPAVIDNTTEQRIFNAGTPQQTDIADNSAGEVFLLEIDKEKHVTAQKIQTGPIRFIQKQVVLQHGQRLQDALGFPDLDPATVSLRVILSGVALQEDYEERGKLYEKLNNLYIKAEIKDENLRKEITSEMIGQEIMEGSVISQLLNSYLDNPELLNLAYDLAISCKGGQ